MDVLKPSIAPYFIQCKSTLNFLRLCRLITTICSDLLRDILSRYIKPADLRSKLDANRTKLEKVMNAQQKEQIYNNTGNRLLTAKDLDISLLYILLRNLSNIPEHRNGWGKVPHLADKSIAACIERIRIQRNLISAHSTNGRVEESEFKNHWTELQDAVIEIENQMIGGDLYGRGINVLYSCDIDITLGQAEIYKRDLDRMQGPPNVITGCDTCIESNTVILIAQVFPYENLSGTEEVFWTKNGERINTQESNEKYSGIRIDYPSLTIKKVNQQDAGSYQFTATNSMGTTKSDIIVLDVPTISLQNTETKEDGSQLFKVRVESIPAPIFAIWKVKTTNDDKVFELLDINAEQYKGTLNSLPQPVLVVKQKECLETHLFQIEVYNFIGSSTTIIPTDLQPENIETDNIANDNLEMFYNNGGANVKFSNLFDDIAENIPEFKVNRLKDIIQNSCKLEDVGSLRRATSARDCIRILKNAKLFTASDVIFIQYVLKKLDCEELYSKCYIYAETQKALCFYEKPTENGYKNVQFHVRGNLTEYSTKQVKKIKETVAAILECSPEEIILIGYCPSNSFFVVLSIKDAYLSKLLKIGQSDKYKLSKLNIDYLIIDLFIFYIEPLKEQEWNIYFDQTRPRRSNDEKKSWKKQQTLAEGTRVLQEVTKYQEDQDDGYSYEFRTRSNSRESRDSGSCSIASHCSANVKAISKHFDGKYWDPKPTSQKHELKASWDSKNTNMKGKELRLVLLGKTGSGKSATANTILGNCFFKSTLSGTSVTRKCAQKSVVRFGHKIVIVDTPGIFDTEQSNEQIQEEIYKCIGITAPGPHAFIMVINVVSRYTQEEQSSVEHFVRYFGENIHKYFIVLFTRKDELEANNIKLIDHIKSSPPSLRNFIQKCGGRVCAFNNRLFGEAQEEQVQELLKEILANVKKAGGQCYTNKMYMEAERQLARIEEERLKKEKEERNKELQVITKKIVDDYNQKLLKQTQKLQMEQKRLDDLIQKQMKDENQIAFLKKGAEMFKKQVEISKDKENQEYQKQLEDMRNELKDIKDCVAREAQVIEELKKKKEETLRKQEELSRSQNEKIEQIQQEYEETIEASRNAIRDESREKIEKSSGWCAIM